MNMDPPDVRDMHHDVPASYGLEANILRNSYQSTLQVEYDKAFESYRKGCRGCRIEAQIIASIAKKLGLEIKEQDWNPS